MADRLRIEDRGAVLMLTPAERVELALALGARDLESFRLAHQPALESPAAVRMLERRRQAGRRRCRPIEELIG
ncbi:MAG: hypothetical protein ACREJV_04180 [Candidatus Rokuibacteriota bacterium]